MKTNKYTCYVCRKIFDANSSKDEDFCQDCLEKIDTGEIAWHAKFAQYLSDEDFQELLDKEVKKLAR